MHGTELTLKQQRTWQQSNMQESNNSDYLPIVSMIATIGKNKAITINPTATARNTRS